MNIREFFIGIGSVLAIFPTGAMPQVKARVGNDRDNLAGDWVAVGNDMRKAIDKVVPQDVKATAQ